MLDEQGRLLLDMPGGQVIQDAPLFYQEDAAGQKQRVQGRFVLRGEGALPSRPTTTTRAARSSSIR
jgi:hypothetical protein